MGEKGDPWASPHSIRETSVTLSSRRMRAFLSCMNELTNLTRETGEPCRSMRSTRCRLSVASKAPFTSNVIIKAVRLVSRACSMSWVRQTRRSVAERLGSAPAYCGLSTRRWTAICETLLATSLSRPLPRQERSEINLHEQMFAKSFLSSFLSITTSAVRNGKGWWLTSRPA
jgi:hypothetical protein